MAKAMTDEDLKIFLDSEEKEAVGYAWGEISDQRAMNMRYYNGEPFGNEIEGRSQVVTSHVNDSIEWILPSLIRIFASTDKAVEFDAQSEEDAEGAKQATETGNYVFWRQNPGFLIMYSWFKDALVSKNGAVKWWWEKKVSKKREKYQGLSLDSLTLMMNEPDRIEIISKTEYPDPTPLPPPPPPQPGQPAMPPPAPQMLYDVEIEITDTSGKCCIAPIPPEELLVSRRHNSILLDDCPYVAHLCKKTLSDLRDMGYEFEDEDVLGDKVTHIDDAPEKLAREEKEDWEMVGLNTNPKDPSLREVWIREAYVLVDVDGDGIAERRRIVRAGNKILENETCESIQIAAITPKIVTHRFYGTSIAEEVMDLQLLASTLWRSMIDNLFAANNQGHIVLASSDGRVQANIDDLLTSRPNRVIREYVAGAVRPEVTPWVAHQTFPMLDYIDQQRMNRTGSSNLTSGLDADAINKTARGATLADNKMNEKIELIARIFAETGVKALFKGILYMLSKYNNKPMTYRLLNKYVTVDPRSWKTSYDMVTAVGIGTGNKDQQLVHLQAIAQAQAQAVAAGGMGLLVTPKNIFNAQAKICENAGFKNPAEFWTDPGENMPQQPEPQPDPIKLMELQIKDKEAGIKQFQAETDRQKADAEIRVKAGGLLQDGENWDKDRQLEAAKALSDLEEERREFEHQRALAEGKDIVRNAVFDLKKNGDTNKMKDRLGGSGIDLGELPEEAPTQESQLLAAIAHGQSLLTEQMQLLTQLIARPKVRIPERGPDGKIIQVTESIQ
jgi:hypothetical protein